MKWITVVASMLLAALASGFTSAQNIDMSTLPARDSVQLTIYNGLDLTLVRETRHVTLKRGDNQLQFSWANTLIDPTSVGMQFAPGTTGVEIVDTRFPHDRQAVLYWTVRAERDAEIVAQIIYFTSGISWSADYVGVVDPAEGAMTFDGYVTVTNNSGEDYENANVRMVVGTINLVEAVADLATRPMKTVQFPWQAGRDGVEPPHSDLTGVDFNGDANDERFSLGLRLSQLEAKVLVKEGLSEYFIFTVPGEETVKNGWSKRMRLFNQKSGESVPFRTEYRYRPQEYGDQLVRLFLVRNDEASKLGESPLPDGAVRFFKQTGDKGDGLSVLAFVTTKYVPIGQEFEFNLGRDPQVILERLVMEQSRDDFWFHTKDAKRLVSPTKGERIDPSSSIAGWNDHAKRVERVRNYRSGPITAAWRYGLDGDTIFRSGLNPTLFDYRTPEFLTTVNAGETKDLPFEVIIRQGTNAKQARVELAND